MDSIFKNQDLVRLIIDKYEAATRFKLQKKRQQFRKLAMLSKAFFDACADHLWEEIDSLAVYINLFPSDQLIQINNNYYLEGPITALTLDRWKVYSHRTKVLSVGQTDSRDLSQVYAIILEYQAEHRETLFPNLYQIKVSSADDPIAFSILSASASLRSVTFEEAPKDLVRVSMKRLVHRAPQLTELVLQAPRRTSALYNIPDFDHLASLKLDLAFDPNHFEYIDRFSSLPHFVMNLHSQTQTPWTIFSVSLSGMIHRNRMLYMAGDLAIIRKWVTALPLAGISHLVLTSPTMENSFEWVNILGHIGNHGSDLVELRVKSKEGKGIEPGTLAEAAIFSLRNLTIIDVDLDCRAQLYSHEEAEELLRDGFLLPAKDKGRSLQNLNLVLHGTGFPLSLAALEDVAILSSEIVTLGISLDTSLPFDSFPNRPLYSLPCSPGPCSLKDLSIWDSRRVNFEPQDFRKISLLLDHHFPLLKTFEVSVAQNWLANKRAVEAGWKVITELRHDYQSLRDHSLTNP